eukprot:TRINITY_DN12586_c0_g1_i9.p1 TRINITY_DN12586_c0_g1~~TRINITY_DN12586_c0_g1_i9.p1  ORF type:complete len:414 (+),score=56.47 TRINITY_DN12586_c0_g1_i9:30-1271(+)
MSLKMTETTLYDTMTDIVVETILGYLEIKDMKTLREVSKRFAETVITKIPAMRNWKIHLTRKNIFKVSHTLENAKSKGIADLPNFRLNFNIEDQRNGNCMRLVRIWKEKVVTLDICPIITLLNFHLPNLENLNILKTFNSHVDIDAFKDLVNAHKTSLLKVSILDIDTFGSKAVDFKDLGFKNLEILSLQGPLKPLLNLSSCVTKLNLKFEATSGLTGSENFKFPNLKQLSTAGNDNFKIVVENADHLEVLIVTLGHCNLHIRFPTLPPMPKLKTLIVHQTCDSQPVILGKLLSSAQTSLQHLVIRGPPHDMGAPLQMTNLTHFVVSNMTKWGKSMIDKNVETLRAVYLDLQNVPANKSDPSERQTKSPTHFEVESALKRFDAFLKKFLKQLKIDPEMVAFLEYTMKNKAHFK